MLAFVQARDKINNMRYWKWKGRGDHKTNANERQNLYLANIKEEMIGGIHQGEFKDGMATVSTSMNERCSQG